MLKIAPSSVLKFGESFARNQDYKTKLFYHKGALRDFNPNHLNPEDRNACSRVQNSG